MKRNDYCIDFRADAAHADIDVRLVADAALY